MAVAQERLAHWKQDCEVCGKPVIHSKTTKNQRAIVLEATTFSERKALGRFVLTDKGAKAIGIHDQLCGDEGHPIHIHRQSLSRALKNHQDLKELHEALREATFAVPYDKETHQALKHAFEARSKELGVTYGNPNMKFDADQPSPQDPEGWRPQGSGFHEQVYPDDRREVQAS